MLKERGVAFAVWAPNASGVSVVGDFCAWDARLFPMRCLGASGVFELARAEEREHVHCATKANILKLSDGLFLDVARKVARERGMDLGAVGTGSGPGGRILSTDLGRVVTTASGRVKASPAARRRFAPRKRPAATRENRLPAA